MATPLDIGILNNIQIIFPFLLVVVFSIAALSRIPVFKEKMALTGVVAFVLGILAITSPIVIKTINLMSPWFVLLIIFAVFVLLAYQSFGIEEKTIVGVLTDKEYGTLFSYWMLAIVLMIALGSLATVLAEEGGGIPGPGAPGTNVPQQAVTAVNDTTVGQSGAFWNTLFHPKVLGLALILLIAMFTVQKLVKND